MRISWYNKPTDYSVGAGRQLLKETDTWIQELAKATSMLPRRDQIAQVDYTVATRLYAAAEHAREALGWCLGHLAEYGAAAETEIHRCRITRQKVVEDARKLYGPRAKGYYQDAARTLDEELADQTSMRDQLRRKAGHVQSLLNSSVSAIRPGEKPGRHVHLPGAAGAKVARGAGQGPAGHKPPAGMDGLFDADVRRKGSASGTTQYPTIDRTTR